MQDAAADEQTARLDPRVAGLPASHVRPDIASKAASIANLTEPPALWFMAAMAVMFLNVKRRGDSTARIAAAMGVSVAIAAALNAVLPGRDRHAPVSLGAAAVAALGITTALFARHWLDPRQAKIAVAGIGAAAAGFALAMAIAGQPFTTLAAGACLATAVTATVEAAARARWGRRLADQAPGLRHIFRDSVPITCLPGAAQPRPTPACVADGRAGWHTIRIGTFYIGVEVRRADAYGERKAGGHAGEGRGLRR